MKSQSPQILARIKVFTGVSNCLNVSLSGGLIFLVGVGHGLVCPNHMTLDHVISRASPPYLPLFSHFRSIVPIQSFTAYAWLNGAVITVAKPTAMFRSIERT